MFLQSIFSLVPEQGYKQSECWEIFSRSRVARTLKASSVDLVKKILLGDSWIDKRHFAVDPIEMVFDMSAESLNKKFEELAPKLAAKTLCEVLERSELRPSDLDALFVCTCTGYLCPGLSSHIAERVGMRADSFLIDIVGHGCGAALPTLHAVKSFLNENPSCYAAAVSVELSSTAFYVDDDPGCLVSMCIFADGCCATLWHGSKEGLGWQSKDFFSLHIPKNRELLRFENAYGKLRNKLHRTVPVLAAGAVFELYKKYEDNPSVHCRKLIVHPGGKEVLIELKKRFPANRFEESAEVLRDYGNMSSPSVLFAFQKGIELQLKEKEILLFSFGAGFSCHGCRMSRVN
ncbi:naringenin-chalcone synthase [Methylacidiphilum caldifontis]|uniref:type III polyketide synthase n=1 Tax=Methylacidiphilum caldifontis TaxID=2795386 RepID=UPI001A8FE876|nr:3-oxoacyl-[acyl-carrier-protein] synthase III C-terminal domain-containing protein [Methylacidiphilum caldifontis]QSR89618.1 naringenin-chalcone synthase [Methylacidiphilum caldifontis]